MSALDYGLVVPGDWWRLDLTAPDGGAAQVRRLVRRLTGGADVQAQLRRELVEHFDAACADAIGRGGVDLYLSTGGPSGTLVAASLLVTVTPQRVGAGNAGTPERRSRTPWVRVARRRSSRSAATAPSAASGSTSPVTCPRTHGPRSSSSTPS